MTAARFLIVACALEALAASGAVQAQDARVESAMTTARNVFRGDVHDTAGLQCTSCHAPIPPGADEFALIARTQIAPLCARCHSDPAYMRQFDPQVRVDQFAQYLTSAHGKAMTRGETRVATCSDCHGSHGVMRVRDSRSTVAPLKAAETCARCHADPVRMKPFGHDAAAFDDWSGSVHAAALLKRRDTFAPTCNTCHGSHGATPPGVTQVASVCAQCHVREADLFNASPKKALFDAMGQAECLVCHSNHRIQSPADAWIDVKPPAVCATCHDASGNGAATISQVRQGLDGLTSAIANATAVVDRAEHAGMLVDEARVALHKAHEQLVQARVLVHAFASEPFIKVASPGMEAAQSSRLAGERALEELQTRRLGLAVATLFIIGFLLTLAWKIRRLPVPP